MTRSRPRVRVPWLWLLVGLVVVGLGVAAYVLLRPKASAASAPTVETATVQQGVFRVSVSGPGTLEPVQSLAVKPAVNGTVLKLPTVGDRVQKGQLIVQLDPTNYTRALENARLALQKAQANLDKLRADQASAQATNRQSVASAEVAYANARRDLEAARTNLQATQKLYDLGGASAQSLQSARDAYAKAQAALEVAQVNLNTARQALSLRSSANAQDLRNAQIAVEQARLEVKNAEENLAATKIYAPFDGVVSEVNAQVGSIGVGATVSNSTALLTLIDDSSLNLPAQIDESEIARVKVGQKVEVTLDAFSGETFEGKVTAIAPKAQIQQNIAFFYVTVNIPNPERKLRPGMSAEGEIVIEEIQGALTVPKRAVQTVRNRAYVDVLQPDGSKETVRVVLGPDDGVNQVIREGLQPGQTVVLPSRTPSSSSSQSGQGGLRLPLGAPPGGGR
ncbi:MAG: efflux RND transporter periplasmic adaptor subunit [Meiothermus sp.]|uniref:efflux RND transporter periplasmic adaptor subunit n=1 Tax=Meiothermus sp. TaxID=1955249 RepID=UPI0025FA9E85|nr:efflux RND transporter periplasmic adaptor subunit [Meiothermus sp.]MCS7068415.1 efflux RND transporter periplasmic adaptor subunit [Meiothermus sp.]MDW8425232.1 efflux RND transporter periplasmic adaptor subunit [Meiothermus sp.]